MRSNNNNNNNCPNISAYLQNNTLSGLASTNATINQLYSMFSGHNQQRTSNSNQSDNNQIPNMNNNAPAYEEQKILEQHTLEELHLKILRYKQKYGTEKRFRGELLQFSVRFSFKFNLFDRYLEENFHTNFDDLVQLTPQQAIARFWYYKLDKYKFNEYSLNFDSFTLREIHALVKNKKQLYLARKFGFSTTCPLLTQIATKWFTSYDELSFLSIEEAERIFPYYDMKQTDLFRYNDVRGYTLRILHRMINNLVYTRLWEKFDLKPTSSTNLDAVLYCWNKTNYKEMLSLTYVAAEAKFQGLYDLNIFSMLTNNYVSFIDYFKMIYDLQTVSIYPNLNSSINATINTNVNENSNVNVNTNLNVNTNDGPNTNSLFVDPFDLTNEITKSQTQVNDDTNLSLDNFTSTTLNLSGYSFFDSNVSESDTTSNNPVTLSSTSQRKRPREEEEVYSTQDSFNTTVQDDLEPLTMEQIEELLKWSVDEYGDKASSDNQPGKTM